MFIEWAPPSGYWEDLDGGVHDWALLGLLRVGVEKVEPVAVHANDQAPAFDHVSGMAEFPGETPDAEGHLGAGAVFAAMGNIESGEIAVADLADALAFLFVDQDLKGKNRA